jgi:sterol desaturase/sphingolipid hydroxylase (fatty acid hydroxylase superfamily)
LVWDIFGLRGLLLAILVFVPLERLFALRKEQRLFRQYWTLDVLYALFNSLLTKVGLAIIMVASISAADWVVPGRLREWVAALPLWLQVLGALVISDVTFYVVHRLFHEIPWMWKFHAVHHSIQELDWLAAHRVHPVDQILTKGGSVLLIFALGFSDAAIGIYSILYAWQSLILHSNLNWRFGALSWIVATPQFHHWHHADHREAHDKNFAGQLSILDACFGTLYLPGNEYPQRYGTSEPVPRRYIEQLRYPFTRPASRADATPATDQL